MKILIVDDHVLIRDALGNLLKKLRRGTDVLKAPDGQKALDILETHADVGMVVLDLNLPDRDGFSLLSEVRERFPALAIVVLSGMQDSGRVRKALDLGALGFIPKTAGHEVLLNAFRLILGGGVYVPPEILTPEETPNISVLSTNSRSLVSPAEIGLSRRQTEVLALLMQGKSNKLICRTLNLTENTVKHHVAAILRALKVNNRTEAVLAASELGWKFAPTPET